MANYNMRFYDSLCSTHIETVAQHGLIRITIDDESTGSRTVWIERSTAIRFQRELKRQIALIEE